MNRKSLAYILIIALALSLWPKAAPQSSAWVENPAAAAECRQEQTENAISTEEKLAEINSKIKKSRYEVKRSAVLFLGSTALLVFFAANVIYSSDPDVADMNGTFLCLLGIPLSACSIISLIDLFAAGDKLGKLKKEKRKLRPTFIFNPKTGCYAVGLAWRF